jgi:hypothetical protein
MTTEGNPKEGYVLSNAAWDALESAQEKLRIAAIQKSFQDVHAESIAAAEEMGLDLKVLGYLLIDAILAEQEVQTDD